MIKAVIFDVDGVLLDSFEANLKFFQDLMTYSGFRPPTAEEYSQLFHLSVWDLIKELTGLSLESDIKKIWDLADNRTVRYPVELLKTPDNIEAVILGLGKDYLLGVVTSRIGNSVYEAPELAKLEPHFLVTISYEDTINHKPHPEPLLLAAQKLGVEPGEAVYIGDAENDVKAARAAGMKVIFYSQETTKDADACTSSFASLPELIKTL